MHPARVLPANAGEWPRWLLPALALTGTAAFVAAVFGVGANNDLLSSYDFRESLSYYREILARAIRAGHLPLWNPHTFGGWPFLADPETALFYPANLVYVGLPQRHAVVADAAAHLLGAWLGTAYWARRGLGLARGPAFFAGLAFIGCGFIVSRGYAGHLTFLQASAFLPWLAVAAQRAREAIIVGGPQRLRSAAAWTALGGLLLGLQILTGALPIAWLSAVGIGLFALGDLALRKPRPSWRSWWQNAVALAALAALGAGIAAVQLVPSRELADFSNRPQHDYAYSSTNSFDPAYLVTAVDPRVVLDPSVGIPWHEMYAYMGLLPLVLALLGAVAAAHDRRVLALLPAAIFMALYMLGDRAFLHRWLFEWVPSFDVFRVPARALLIVQLVVALLAAVGLQALLNGLPQVRRSGLRAAVMVAVASLVTLADVTSAARWHRPVLLGAGNEPARARLGLQVAERNTAPLRADPSWYRYWASPGILPHNYAVRIDRRSINGYAGMMPARYQRFIGAMTGYGTEGLGMNLLNPEILARAPRFSLKVLGVKYEMVRGQLFERPDGPDVPRAWLVTGVRRVADGADALRYMSGPAFRPLEEAVLEPDAVRSTDRPVAADATATPPVPISVRESAPERLQIAVGPGPAGILVLSEMFYPGWEAAVDGRELPIVRCDYVLRCLRLETRSQAINVDLVYAPASVRVGSVVSLLTLVLAAGTIALSRRSAMRAPHREPSAT